ncbi:M20/M25/M40 family metallo-hydrolase [Natronoflexus pectinivorans]|uniref:Leucyl aminopeptidase n=1 Tax=Natronoflexus pectinivorans TaxID=682526 RepID=A0A4R2GS18_9BACT|nr:M20/M25/M40 family metallo-hydrolase [Natronoflexus pectinivorans]TCO10986.1 leucyl aminopeptidase [Natronoflexus pectinivorans]
MKRKHFLITYFFLSLILLSSAQQNEFIYATVSPHDAELLKTKFPSEVEILGSNHIHTALYISEAALLHLKEIRQTPGPGYVFRQSREAALAAIHEWPLKTTSIYEFSINQQDIVNLAIELVDPINIEEHIILLENYGTRFHTKESATQSAIDLREMWEDLASTTGRDDIKVELFEHTSSPMPSVIMSVPGLDEPDEIVIIGAHLDSTVPPNNGLAPGADDNASGVATITEVARILFEINFVPAKTIEFMAYSAEEVGLIGSAEIVSYYREKDKNVIAYVNFDMTNYKGSAKDVYLMTDSYNSSNLNDFLMELMDYYNSSGNHQFEYSTTICNYGCSDNYSWAEAGYEAAFPFEAKLNESNPNIHTIYDTYSFMGNSLHAAKFAKLGLQFMIEASKSSTSNIPDTKKSIITIYTKSNKLHYSIDAPFIETINIYNLTGQLVKSRKNNANVGVISIEQGKGFFLVEFVLQDKGRISEKIIIY